MVNVHDIYRRFTVLRYFIFGAAAAFLHVFILSILVEYTLLSELISSCIGFIAAVTANYWMQRIYTFHSTIAHTTAFPKFILTATAGFFLNGAAFYSMLPAFGYIFSQLLSILLVFLLNFAINKHFVF